MCRLEFLAALVGVVIAVVTTDVTTVGAVSLAPGSPGTSSPTTATTQQSTPTPPPNSKLPEDVTKSTTTNVNSTTPTEATTVTTSATPTATTTPTTTGTTTATTSSTTTGTTTATTSSTTTDTTTATTSSTTTDTTTATTSSTTTGTTTATTSSTTTDTTTATTTPTSTGTTTATTTATEFTTPKENCTAEQRRLACELLQKYSKNLTLTTAHASGMVDNAFARNNVRDMCDGKKAARSSYSCKECPTGAPGGTVCIRESVLKYIAAVAAKGRVQINEIAGACHSCTSKHYQGLAVDLDHGIRRQEYLDKCRQMGGTGIDERNHIHCHFNN